ncbi:MAG: serine/threonine-protein kinase [Polyangiaceae bacterium]
MSDDDSELSDSLPVREGMVIGGKFRVEKLLAAGGMGAVLRAHHEILDKPVAIKLIRPELATRRDIAQRFLREARAAAKITSDYVARVTDVDLLDEKTPFMVMEFLEGQDLNALMEKRGRLPIALAVDLTLQGLLGLEAAHAKGVVHRDLKPSNLFLEERSDGSRRVKLLDFGISKVLDADDTALKAGATTSAGQMLGTPRYMSPEQVASAKNVDHRTDLWAMGLILYEMLTAVYPFEGSSSGQILANILTTQVQPLRELRPDVPEDLSEVLEKCLAKDRDARFPDARNMMFALAPFASKRMQALLHEHDEIAGDPTATERPRAAGARSPAPLDRASDVASEPTRAAPSTPTKATRIAREAVETQLASPLPVAATHVSAKDESGASPPSSPALTPSSVKAGQSTETGMSVADSKPSRIAPWKIVAGAVALAAVAAAVFVATRPNASAPAAQTTTTTAKTEAPLAERSTSRAATEEVHPIVEPKTSEPNASAIAPSNPSAIASASASSASSAPKLTSTARAMGTTAAPTTKPTASAKSSDPGLNSRD